MGLDIDIYRKFVGFTLEVQLKSDSKRIGILGASGCGKSMTLKSIAGINKLDRGKIVNGDKIYFDSERKINVKPQKRKVGYLFQNYALFPNMTVEKNIAAGLHGSKLDIENRVARMIEKFQLKGLEKRIPKELSGGQQQRVALARIMAYEPDIIMLDEPFSALDMFLKDRLQEEMIDMLKDYSGTIIIVSHNRDEIYRFSDELLIMDKGRHVCFGKTKDIFANPLKMEAAKLTGCKNISKIRKIDDFHLMATDWGIKLETDVFISDNIRYVGIRAHDLEPVWDVREKNCLRVDVFSISELPFETQYYLRPESESNSQNTICWYVSKHTLQLNERYSIPQYLRLPKNKLLLLT